LRKWPRFLSLAAFLRNTPGWCDRHTIVASYFFSLLCQSNMIERAPRNKSTRLIAGTNWVLTTNSPVRLPSNVDSHSSLLAFIVLVLMIDIPCMDHPI
jgi:hypothetical protein